MYSILVDEETLRNTAKKNEEDEARFSSHSTPGSTHVSNSSNCETEDLPELESASGGDEEAGDDRDSAPASGERRKCRQRLLSSEIEKLDCN